MLHLAAAITAHDTLINLFGDKPSVGTVLHLDSLMGRTERVAVIANDRWPQVTVIRAYDRTVASVWPSGMAVTPLACFTSPVHLESQVVGQCDVCAALVTDEGQGDHVDWHLSLA